MVRILTDSAADFEPWELEMMGVICIPQIVMFGQTEYRADVDLSKERFYELLKAAGELPKTAQGSPELLLEHFEAAKRAGDQAVYICLSSALSGTYQSAEMVRRLCGWEGCCVVDSLNATGGQRILVEHAVRLRDEGKAAADIAARVEALRGRISQTSYALGSIAQIKPIIQVDRLGRVTIPAKMMGMRRGIDWLCKRTQQQPPDEAFPFYVMYTDDRRSGQLLALRLRELGYGIPEERIIQVGAAIGTHIGPNAVGLVYVGR